MHHQCRNDYGVFESLATGALRPMKDEMVRALKKFW
jgi:hypothetical protein